MPYRSSTIGASMPRYVRGQSPLGGRLVGPGAASNDSSGPAPDPGPDPAIPVPAAIGDTITVSVDSSAPERNFLIRSDTAVDRRGLCAVSLGDRICRAVRFCQELIYEHSRPRDTDLSHILFVRTGTERLKPGEPWFVKVISGSLPPRKATVRFYIAAVNGHRNRCRHCSPSTPR